MGLASLRRFDIQATYACILSVSGAVPTCLAAVLLLSRYNAELAQIIYGSKGLFLPVFLGCVVVSMLLGGVGFALGWNSAGQRRNDRATRSWVGFFLGGGVLTLDVILLLAFWMLRLEKPV